MDDICKILDDCASWIESSATPKVLFAGMTPILQFRNPPATHIEMSFMELGSVESLKIGEREESLPEGWISVHGIHFGNYSPPKRERGRSWCAMLDASEAPPCMDYLKRRPFFAAAKHSNPSELVDAFLALRRLCIRQGYAPGHYDASLPMFSPDLANSDSGLKLRVKAAILNLIGSVLEGLHGEGRKTEGRPDPIEAALRMIEADYTSPGLSLDSLASKACLSVDHFGRLFKAHLGQSPMAYARSLRMREAASLLRNTGDRVEKIARTVGYEDPLHFSRLFHKEFKMSPRAFRKKGLS